MVSHGHVTVNGRKTNISSMNLKAGDKIAVRSNDRSKRLATKAVDQTSAISTPDWLDCGQGWPERHGCPSANQSGHQPDRQRTARRRVVFAITRAGPEFPVRTTQRPPFGGRSFWCRACHSSQSRLIPQGMPKTEDAPPPTVDEKAAAIRAKNLDLAIQQIEKDYGSEAIRRLGDATILRSKSFQPETS